MKDEQLSVATYNIENFYPGVSSAKINKLAESIVNNIKSPDIIGLVEVQDNNGEQNNGTTAADQSYQTLINAIKAAGGPTYNFTDIAPVNNNDGERRERTFESDSSITQTVSSYRTAFRARRIPDGIRCV